MRREYKYLNVARLYEHNHIIINLKYFILH